MKEECSRYLALAPMPAPKSSVGSATIGNTLDRQRERTPEQRRIGLAIDGYMRTTEWRKHLGSRASNKGEFVPRYGLHALFNVVPITVDRELRRAQHILPPDHRAPKLESAPDVSYRTSERERARYGYHNLFPLLADEHEWKQLKTSIEHLENMCSLRLDEEFSPQRPLPALYRGTNTFVYDSADSLNLFWHNGECVPSDVWLLSRNVNFIQLLPRAGETIAGFFQLQSAMPGLVEALFPHCEFHREWPRTIRTATGQYELLRPGATVSDAVCATEIPPSPVQLIEHLDKSHGRGEYVLEGIYWLLPAHSMTPWADRLYNQIQYLDEFEDRLEMEIEPRINAAHSHKLNLLIPPLRRLSEALSEIRADTQELRAVLYHPEESLFASYAEIAPFFVNRTCRDFRARHFTIAHVPEKYDPPTLKFVMAVLLCSVFGESERLRKTNMEQFFSDASEVLHAVSERETTKPLVSDLKWLLAQDGSPISPLLHNLELRDWFTWPDEDEERRKHVVRALENLKNVLYRPFKPDDSMWVRTALELLVRSPEAQVKMGDFPGDSIKVTPSPVAYASVLGFIRDVAVLKARPSTLYVEKARTVRTIKQCWDERVFDEKHIDRVKQATSRILAHPEWRVSSSHYGDETRPFVLLANRILGLNQAFGWTHAPSNDRNDRNVVVSVLHHTYARYSLTITPSMVTHEWSRP